MQITKSIKAHHTKPLGEHTWVMAHISYVSYGVTLALRLVERKPPDTLLHASARKLLKLLGKGILDCVSKLNVNIPYIKLQKGNCSRLKH